MKYVRPLGARVPLSVPDEGLHYICALQKEVSLESRSSKTCRLNIRIFVGGFHRNYGTMKYRRLQMIVKVPESITVCISIGRNFVRIHRSKCYSSTQSPGVNIYVS